MLKPVFNFHAVNDENIKFHDDFLYSISKTQFKAVLNILSKSNREFQLSFDDGHLSDLEIVAPMLKKHGLSATFFVLTDEIETNEFKWRQTKDLSQMGFDIGLHGKSHKRFDKISPHELKKQLEEALTVLEGCIGKKVDRISLPYGKYNSRVIELLKSLGFNKIYTTKGLLESRDGMLIHRFNVTSINPEKNINICLNQKPKYSYLVIKLKSKLKLYLN